MQDLFVRTAHIDFDSYMDGDTFGATLDLGCRVSRHERIRLLGINAPELKGPSRLAGAVSRDWLRDRLNGHVVTVQTFKDDYDSFGRYLAIVYADGINVNEEMVQLGLAVPFYPK